jgi:hypothetical protein
MGEESRGKTMVSGGGWWELSESSTTSNFAVTIGRWTTRPENGVTRKV